MNKCMVGLKLAFDFLNLVQETEFGSKDLK